MSIFFSSQISFSLRKQAAVKKALLTLIRKEKKKPGDISYTFCNDKFLLSLNKKFLHHNTLTDIITFQYSSTLFSGKSLSPRKTNLLSGEIFISIPRVRENSKMFGVSFDHELHRVMMHGVLHLCGYKDKNKSAKAKMRKKEDQYLDLLH
jgi:rRNA maturation RNase YbeY